jgi:hypothetical protein
LLKILFLCNSGKNKLDTGKLIFQKLGGKYQPIFERPADLRFIELIDEAHWAALSAPVEAFQTEKEFLEYLDKDGNGTIRCDEIKKTAKWLLGLFSDISRLKGGHEELRPANINSDSEEGRALLDSINSIYPESGENSTGTISLDSLRREKEMSVAKAGNDNGIIPFNAIISPETRKFAEDAAVIAGETENNAPPEGFTKDIIKKFMALAANFTEWKNKSKLPDGQDSTDILPLGADTAEGYKAFSAIEAKTDEFFALCGMLDTEPSAAPALLPGEGKIAAIDINNTESISLFTTSRPIAGPNPAAVLDLDGKINTEYKSGLEAFRNSVLKKFDTGKHSKLTVTEWKEIKKAFSPYADWLKEAPSEKFSSIDENVLGKYLSGTEAQNLEKLFEESETAREKIKKIEEIEKVILFQKNFFEFINNFISFNRLFDPRSKSMIQPGSLVMDERRFDLVVKISNPAEHKKLARKSNICVIYLKLRSGPPDKTETMEAVAGITSGVATSLYVGKKGVFFEKNGKVWESEISDMIIQPVSLSEALRMPFVKIGEFTGKQFEKITDSRYKGLEAGIAENIRKADKSVATLNPQPQQGGLFSGGSMLLLGGGVGLAALGSSLAFTVKTMKNVSFLNAITVIAVIIAIIFSPFLVLAFVKLKKRNVGMFFEAAGWAVNGRFRLSGKMGRIFTYKPELPAGARKKRIDKISFFSTKRYIKRQYTRNEKIYCVLLTALIFFITGYLIFMATGLNEIIFTGK